MRILRAKAKSGAGADSRAEGQGQGKIEMKGLGREERGTLPEGVRELAEREGWEGLRVEMEGGWRVEVRYWWRVEEGDWVQCFHDLISVGLANGDEGGVGETVFGRG